MSFSTEEVLEEFVESTRERKPSAVFPPWLRLPGGRVWNQERELARSRAKYLREVATPEGIERRRRWSRETYRRTTETPEGRQRLREKAMTTYRRNCARPGWIEARRASRRKP